MEKGGNGKSKKKMKAINELIKEDKINKTIKQRTPSLILSQVSFSQNIL
jgi:hypothetical protein